MLYLAEVLRKTRVIGGGRAEFKLLACQRSEQSWSMVPGEEIIAAPDDASYSAGVLVMVELSAAKQVQRHMEAGRQLVSILHTFSRLQEKAKTQEEEIEQWKQSLTYQSQELNRREMEMEARLEQLQQMEEEMDKFEEQRQAIESSQIELDRLREEFERKTQELEGAWAQLQGAQSRLEEQQAELQQPAGLDAAEAYRLQELLNRISTALTPTDAIYDPLNQSFDWINHQQNTLNTYWQALDQQRAMAQPLQEEVDRRTHEVREGWQSWHQTDEELQIAKAALQTQQSLLTLKQTYAQTLAAQLKEQEALHHQLAQLGGISTKVDAAALEKMPLKDLQSTVQELEKDLEKLSRFVSSQEEELTLQQDEINELRQHIQQASEYDRLRLETELADEQDRYQMLHETLVGQRRNLQERQTILKQHQAVLAKRQGYAFCEERSVDLDPILMQLDQMRSQQVQTLQQLEAEIQQLQSAIQQAEQALGPQMAEQHSKRESLRQLEEQLRPQIAQVAEAWGRVNTYQEILQPIQDGLNDLRQKAEAIASAMAQFQDTSSHQRQIISELQDTVHRLSGQFTPELAAS